MSVFHFGEFRARPASRRLDWREDPVSLTAKQFDLLLVFLENPGTPLSKQAIREKVWPDTFVEENNLTQVVFQLRKALAAVAGDEPYIETLPKIGYQFVAPVTLVIESAPAAGEILSLEPPDLSRPWNWRWFIAAAAVVMLAGT